jgi:hypothetical protein
MIDLAGAPYKMRVSDLHASCSGKEIRNPNMKTTTKPGRPSDDVWSAPESGTVRDSSSGNQPAQRQDSEYSKPQPSKKTTATGNQRNDSPAATSQRR